MIFCIYIDIFFIANFIMDFTLLKLLEKMRKKKISWRKNVLSSSVGSFGACLVYLFGYGKPRWLFVFGIWMLCQIMILLVYGKQNLWWNIYDVILLFTLSFTFGGIVNYLYYGIGFDGYLKGKSSLVTLGSFLLFSIFSYVLISKIIQIIRKQEKLISYKVQVVIERKGKRAKMQGYIDTGNRLYEPISRKPVILVEFESVKSLFTEEEIEFIEFYLERQGEIFDDFHLEPLVFRLIPYQCAAGNTGFFICVFYDRIYIGDKKEEKKKGYMALQKEKLSPLGEYEVLLHTELM